MDLIKRVLLLFADDQAHLQWDEDCRFWVTCNDVFTNAADAVEITEENIGVAEQAKIDTGGSWWPWLFCARVVKMRPQAKFLECVPAALRPLFEVV